MFVACPQEATNKRTPWWTGGLTVEYERKAGTEPSHVGPVLAKLHSFGEVTGFVFGKWGKASMEVHELIHRLANDWWGQVASWLAAGGLSTLYRVSQFHHILSWKI